MAAARIAHFFRRDGPDASVSAQASTAGGSRHGDDEGVPGEHAGESVYEEINPNPDIWPVIPSTSSFSLNLDQIGQSSLAPRSRKASARSHSQQDSISSHADPFNPSVPGTVGVTRTEAINSLVPASPAKAEHAHDVAQDEDLTLSSVIPSLATSSDPSAGGDWTLSLGLPPPSPPPGSRKTSRPSLPTLLSPLIKSNGQLQRLSAGTALGEHESSSNSDPQPPASRSPRLPHPLELPATSMQSKSERPTTGELDELNAAHRQAHEAYRAQQGDNYTALARKELVKEAREQKEKQRALAQARLANPAIANGPPPIPDDDEGRKKKRFKRWSSSAYTTSSDGGRQSPYHAIPGSSKRNRIHSTGVGTFSLSPPPWKITPGMRRKAARDKARKAAAEQQAVEAARAGAAPEAISDGDLAKGMIIPGATYGLDAAPNAAQHRRSMGAITYNRVTTNPNEDWVDEAVPEEDGRLRHAQSESESASGLGTASGSEAARRVDSRLTRASADDSTSGSGYGTGSSARRHRRDKRRRERSHVSDTWEYQVAESLYLAGIVAQRGAATSGHTSDGVVSGRSDAASASHSGAHDHPATPSRLSTFSAHLTPPLFRRRSDQPSDKSRSRSKLSLGAVSRGSPTPEQLRRTSTRATPEPLAHVIEIEHVDALDNELNGEDSDSDWYDAAEDTEPVTGLVDSGSDSTPVATPKPVDLDVDIAEMIAKGFLPHDFDPTPVGVRLSTTSSVSYAPRRGSHTKRGSLIGIAKGSRLSMVSMRPKLDGRHSVLFANGIDEEDPLVTSGSHADGGDYITDDDYAQVLALEDDGDGGSTTPRASSPQPPQVRAGKTILEAHKASPVLNNRGEIVMLPMPPLPVRSRLPYLPSADANFLPHSPSTLRKMWRKELRQRKRLADAERRRQDKFMRRQRKEALRLQREEQDAERGRRSTAERQGNVVGLGVTSSDGQDPNTVEGLAATAAAQEEAGPSSPPLSIDRASPFSHARSSTAPARWEAHTNLGPPSETYLPRSIVGPQIRTSIPHWKSAWSISSHGEQSSYQTSDSASAHHNSTRARFDTCLRLPAFLLPLTLVPPNAWCFVFGFMLPPLWWIGAFWPVYSFNGRSERWGGFRRSKLLRRQFQSRSTVINSSQLRNIDARRADEVKREAGFGVASATGITPHPMANWSHVRRTSGSRVSWIGDFLAEHPAPSRNESEEAQTFWAFQRSIHMWRLRCRIMSIVSIFLVTLLVVGGVLAGTLR